ncbi:MAG: nicotinamide riboside transporter PnuC [Cyclobacteriaceae bacterium]|nr:nicotinamide riboside transporter PnuC [Cyclobacteriaceae bacterium]
MEFFDIDSIFFEIWGYPMSYLEFFGTIAGFVFVVLSARAHILNWPVGIINNIFFIILFYQVQLYPDMFLYGFFTVTNLIGWWRWSHPRPGEEDRKRELKVSHMRLSQLAILGGIAAVGTFTLGTFASKLHEILPTLFPEPSAFPYLDSFVTVTSIAATYAAIQKKIEVWIVWIIVDLTATYIYFVKGIKFVGVQYFVYTLIAAYGWYNWSREYRSYEQAEVR